MFHLIKRGEWLTRETIIEKLKWLLANPAEASKIRDAGRKRALRDHTWKKRFEEFDSYVRKKIRDRGYMVKDGEARKSEK